MAALLDNLLAFVRRSVAPTRTAGVSGTAIYGGWIQQIEKDSSLTGHDRYKTFSDMLANTSIVAAGTRYFLNLVAKASWKFEPADHPDGEQLAEAAERALTEDPRTPWHRIVRRGTMYRFYGFSVQEWTAKRAADGSLTFKDVAPRPQITIERWDVDQEGEVHGVLQRSPQSGEDIYLPRDKIVYVVDDTLSDSPEGLGLFRHLVNPSKRLERFEQLEGLGFETDLRGVPIGRVPIEELARQIEAGTITDTDRAAMVKPVIDFIQNHIKGPKLGLVLDSKPYAGSDEAQTPSSQRMWDMELLKAGSTSQEAVAFAIERLNHDIARVLGVEGLLLGQGKTGSLALSKDKSHNLFLVVDGALADLAAALEDDLLGPLWRLNGWPVEAMPHLSTSAVRYRDVTQIATTLRDLSMAGAVLAPDDPAVAAVRDLMDLPKPPDGAAMDAMLRAIADEDLAESEEDARERLRRQPD